MTEAYCTSGARRPGMKSPRPKDRRARELSNAEQLAEHFRDHRVLDCEVDFAYWRFTGDRKFLYEHIDGHYVLHAVRYYAYSDISNARAEYRRYCGAVRDDEL